MLSERLTCLNIRGKLVNYLLGEFNLGQDVVCLGGLPVLQQVDDVDQVLHVFLVEVFDLLDLARDVLHVALQQAHRALVLLDVLHNLVPDGLLIVPGDLLVEPRGLFLAQLPGEVLYIERRGRLAQSAPSPLRHLQLLVLLRQGGLPHRPKVLAPFKGPFEQPLHAQRELVHQFQVLRLLDAEALESAFVGHEVDFGRFVEQHVLLAKKAPLPQQQKADLVVGQGDSSSPDDEDVLDLGAGLDGPGPVLDDPGVHREHHRELELLVQLVKEDAEVLDLVREEVLEELVPELQGHAHEEVGLGEQARVVVLPVVQEVVLDALVQLFGDLVLVVRVHVQEPLVQVDLLLREQFFPLVQVHEDRGDVPGEVGEDDDAQKLDEHDEGDFLGGLGRNVPVAHGRDGRDHVVQGLDVDLLVVQLRVGHVGVLEADVLVLGQQVEVAGDVVGHHAEHHEEVRDPQEALLAVVVVEGEPVEQGADNVLST